MCGMLCELESRLGINAGLSFQLEVHVCFVLLLQVNSAVASQAAYAGLGGLGYSAQQLGAGQQAQLSQAAFTPQQPVANSYYAHY